MLRTLILTLAGGLMLSHAAELPLSQVLRRQQAAYFDVEAQKARFVFDNRDFSLSLGIPTGAARIQVMKFYFAGRKMTHQQAIRISGLLSGVARTCYQLGADQQGELGAFLKFWLIQHDIPRQKNIGSLKLDVRHLPDGGVVVGLTRTGKTSLCQAL
ncbi:hypothetical protein [Deinococcus cellulosilyticus]|uniref:hypothetical protein n=1 Tax=Deinococcus cellulosilyticus TaxID=401558 RepID=UPI0011BD5ED1|nr:hypothetical protein [Deinococcus cellulosilyticus]